MSYGWSDLESWIYAVGEFSLFAYLSLSLLYAVGTKFREVLGLASLTVWCASEFIVLQFTTTMFTMISEGSLPREAWYVAFIAIYTAGMLSVLTIHFIRKQPITGVSLTVMRLLFLLAFIDAIMHFDLVSWRVLESVYHVGIPALKLLACWLIFKHLLQLELVNEFKLKLKLLLRSFWLRCKVFFSKEW